MLFRGDYEEKRDFARMGVECPATFTVDGDGTTHHAVATDLSATGLQLKCSAPHNVGVVMMVQVTPEQAIVPPLQARAEVVRCDESTPGAYHLGLKILEMMPGF